MQDNFHKKRIDGKVIAASIQASVKKRLETAQMKPGLAVIQVGDDPASCCYVRHKRQACQAIGIESFAHDLPQDTTESTLLALIQTLNHDTSVHGIMLQLPLPTSINTQRVCNAIAPHKDVDGLSSFNLGKVLSGEADRIIPCTPKGILHILSTISYPIKGSHCTLIGASNIVGKPLALELIRLGATVTICHQYSQDLAAAVKQADCVISAIGKPGIIQTTWLQDQVTVIDIGISKVGNRIIGDIDYASAAPIAKHITPVPGGVGPVTVAMLMQNTLEAYLIASAK